MNLSSIRQSYVGVVEQSIGLLSGSIFDNIAYGKDSATKEDVYKASKLADAHDFIMTLPDQYDTQLGEIGKSLSGGQKARIAIARALIRDPKYLLLDEATAALDRISESEIATTFQRYVIISMSYCLYFLSGVCILCIYVSLFVFICILYYLYLVYTSLVLFLYLTID